MEGEDLTTPNHIQELIDEQNAVLRRNIGALVKRHARTAGVEHRDAWRHLYNQMDFVPARDDLEPGETKLDWLERHGLLGSVLLLAQTM